MKDIILKSGTYLKETKTSHTNSIPGESLENFVISVLANSNLFCFQSTSDTRMQNMLVILFYTFIVRSIYVLSIMLLLKHFTVRNKRGGGAHLRFNCEIVL